MPFFPLPNTSGRTSVGEKGRPSADQRDVGTVCQGIIRADVRNRQLCLPDASSSCTTTFLRLVKRYLVSKTFPVSLSHYKVSNDSLDMYTFAVDTCLGICFHFAFGTLKLSKYETS